MKISVVLPNYNQARRLPECIESVRAQSHRDWELIIVDDGSTDDSWSVIERCAQGDARIQAARFTSNRGIHAALSHALPLCTGELLHPRASDSPLIISDFLRSSVEAFESYPGIATVFAQTHGVDSDGKVLATWGAPQQKNRYISPEQATEEFFHSDYISGESIVLRRELFIEHGGYDERLGPYLDLFINEGLTALYGGVYLDEVASTNQLDPNSFSRRQTARAMVEQSALMERKFRDLPLKVPPRREWIVRYRERKLAQILLYREQQALAETLAQLSVNLAAWPQNRMPAYMASVRAQLATMSNVVREECQASVAGLLAIYDSIAGPLPS